MQNYENNPNVGKKILSEFLGFLKYKVDNDLITMEDMRGILMMLEEGMDIGGTVEDFAGFYGQSVTNVRSVIKRRMIPKPRRKVEYRFRLFQRLIPEKWHITA